MKEIQKQKIIFVVGPTATGKSDLALHLARKYGGEIVSADSVQVYRHMDIGSAKPSREDMEEVPHHMVDIRHPKEGYTAPLYQREASSAIKGIHGRGKVPIVCGGTGLYVHSLLYDMDFSAPEGDRGTRERRAEELAAGGDLHEYLKKLDPAAAERIHPNNRKRIIRAIERLESGEGKLGEFSDKTERNPNYDPIMIGLTMERSALYARIERRVDAMMEDGLVGEVEDLIAMGLTKEDVSMKAIGYKELIVAFQKGKTDEAIKEAADLIKRNTRRYAKRQLTWFKRYGDVEWFTAEDGTRQELYDRVAGFVNERI